MVVVEGMGSKEGGDGGVVLDAWLGWGWRAELVREGVGEVCVGGSRVGGRGVGGLSRIDQALEEADCATFEDEGTITLLGSVSRRRGSQTTRGKAL